MGFQEKVASLILGCIQCLAPVNGYALRLSFAVWWASEIMMVQVFLFYVIP